MTLGTALCCESCITERKQAVPHSACMCNMCIWDYNIKMNLKKMSFDFSLNTTITTEQ